MHRAIAENPGYIDTLKRLSEVSDDMVASPLTEQEITTWQTKTVATVQQSELLQARGALEWLSTDQDHLVGEVEEQFLVGELFRTFGSDNHVHNRLKEQFADRYPEGAIASTDTVLAYREGRDSYFLPNWERAVAYYGALHTITNRLRSEEAQLKAALALGDDTQHELLVRVQRRQRRVSSKRAALNTFTEGYDSVAFAGAQLELGGATNLEDPSRFARAVLGYTAVIPGTGMVAPMALRGEYFKDLTNEVGDIQPGYRDVFKKWQRENAKESQREPYVYEPAEEELDIKPPYIPEYCNAVGFPMPAEVEYMPEYLGEGCAGLHRGIVYRAAQTFMQKVGEFSQDGLQPPRTVTLNLAPIIAAGKASRDRIR